MKEQRAEFSKGTKELAALRAAGHCEKCTAPLRPGKYDYHHLIEAALGGSNELSNCAVWCDACHDPYTATVSTPRVAKMKRQRASHIGAATPTRKKIQSRGFTPAAPKTPATAPVPKSMPRKPLYE